MAKRYAHHWRCGEIRPHELVEYMEGRMDAIDAGVAVGVPPGAARLMGQVGMRVLKSTGAFFTSWLPANDLARHEPPDSEIEGMMKKWVARG